MQGIALIELLWYIRKNAGCRSMVTWTSVFFLGNKSYITQIPSQCLFSFFNLRFHQFGVFYQLSSKSRMVPGLGFTKTGSSDAQYPPQLHTASVALATVAVRSCLAEGGPLHRQLSPVSWPCHSSLSGWWWRGSVQEWRNIACLGMSSQEPTYIFD